MVFGLKMARTRSSLKIRLWQEDLRRAPTDALERLANFLDSSPRPKQAGESEAAYRQRLISAIQRWEKMYERGQV